MCRTTRTTNLGRQTVIFPRAPPPPPKDAMEASLTRMGIRQGEEAQLRVDSPWASRNPYSHKA